MGYAKGTIDLSSPQDMVLLQQVLRSRHVTHDQLWQFFQLQLHENRRRIFNWRVSRLAGHGLISRMTTALQSRAWVYTISRSGANHLAGEGEGAALVAQGTDNHRGDRAVLHSLDLNDIHLGLLRTGDLRQWKSEVEILSLMKLGAFGYAKCYDALVTVDCDGQDATFALEYERHPKDPCRYRGVATALNSEQHVSCFLYLMPSYELLRWVARHFEGCSRPVYFGLLNEFGANGLGTKVLDYRHAASVPLRTMLAAFGR